MDLPDRADHKYPAAANIPAMTAAPKLHTASISIRVLAVSCFIRLGFLPFMRLSQGGKKIAIQFQRMIGWLYFRIQGFIEGLPYQLHKKRKKGFLKKYFF